MDIAHPGQNGRAPYKPSRLYPHPLLPAPPFLVLLLFQTFLITDYISTTATSSKKSCPPCVGRCGPRTACSFCAPGTAQPVHHLQNKKHKRRQIARVRAAIYGKPCFQKMAWTLGTPTVPFKERSTRTSLEAKSIKFFVLTLYNIFDIKLTSNYVETCCLVSRFVRYSINEAQPFVLSYKLIIWETSATPRAYAFHARFFGPKTFWRHATPRSLTAKLAPARASHSEGSEQPHGPFTCASRAS